MRGTYIVLPLTLLAWGALTLSASGEMLSPEHKIYYFWMPCAFFAIAGVGGILSLTHWSRLGGRCLQSFALIALLPYLFLYTGGM